MLVAFLLSLLNCSLFYEAAAQVDDWKEVGIGVEFVHCILLGAGTWIEMRVGTVVEAERRAGLSAGEG